MVLSCVSRAHARSTARRVPKATKSRGVNTQPRPCTRIRLRTEPATDSMPSPGGNYIYVFPHNVKHIMIIILLYLVGYIGNSRHTLDQVAPNPQRDGVRHSHVCA